jgi:uncharacterized protein (TIRG00374 family)
MSTDAKQNDWALLNKIKPSHAIIPVVIGLGVIGVMLYRDFDPRIFDNISFTFKSVIAIFVAALCMVGRDLGYIIRIRVLSDNLLSWRRAFRVIMLWEFTSAVTPSAVGGTSVAVIYVNKEGVGLGRSSAIVLMTSFLDELYFIVMFPLVVLLAGSADLFDIQSVTSTALGMGFASIAVIAYSLKFAYVLLISYGLFINPQGIKWLLVKVFSLPFLKKWRAAAEKTGDDIISASGEFKRKSFIFWVKALLSTFLSWSSRYLVANALIMAFFAVGDQFILFARQLVIWIMMLIMPTPGGSGFAEYVFSCFCGDQIITDPSMQMAAATLIALMWRMVTYYPYLVIGAIMFPRWLVGLVAKKNEK